MTKTRFAPWLVFACIGTLVSCTSGDQGTAGNTELNVVIPSGSSQSGPGAPSSFDIQSVEYTIVCADGIDFDPTSDPDINSGPTLNNDVTLNGNLEVLDTAHGGVPGGNGPNLFGPDLDEVYVWQGFMDLPETAGCNVQLRARDGDGEVICTADTTFDIHADETTKVNVLMICGISYQAPVGMLELDGDFQFNVANYCPDLFVFNAIDSNPVQQPTFVPGIGLTLNVAATSIETRFRDADNQCGGSCDPQVCVPDADGVTCVAAYENADGTCEGAPASFFPPTNCGAAGQPECCPQVKGTMTCTSNPGAGENETAIMLCNDGTVVCSVPQLIGIGVCDPAVTSCTVGPNNGGTYLGLTPEALAAFFASLGTTCLDDSECVAAVGLPGAVCDLSAGSPGTCDFSATNPLLGASANVACLPPEGLPGLVPPADGGSPGATITCVVDVTDGDEDCDKSKTFDIACPGLTACGQFGDDNGQDPTQGGGDAACDAASASVCQVGTCSDAGCDGTVGGCCDYAAATDGGDCSSECATGNDCTTSPGQCLGGVCTSSNCNDPSAPACDDGIQCTTDTCTGGGSCEHLPTDGADCDAGNGTASGTCEGSTCTDKCDLTDCSSTNECENELCDSSSGAAVCDNSPNDSNSCTTCAGPSCLCSGGTCIAGCSTPAPQDAIGIPMACRNSFNDAVSTFPIDLLNVTADGCVEDSTAVNFAIDPVIALDTAFLDAAVQQLCTLGTFLSEADITAAQVSVDAVAGATCTEQLSVLTPLPQTVTIASSLTCVGGTTDVGDLCTVDADCTGGGSCLACGSGAITTVSSGISVPLPAMNLPCTAGVAGSQVQLCSTGTVPLAISLTDPPPPPAYTETYVGVEVGGSIAVGFACNTSSTTNPLPGTQIGCTSANGTPSTPVEGEDCAAAVGSGDVGETPYPVSDCNTADGPPIPDQTCLVFGTNETVCTGTCDTVPVGVDPSTVCATFTVDP